MSFPKYPNIFANTLILILLTGTCHGPLSPAATVPASEGFLGKLQQYKVKRSDSLIEIARRFDVGYNSIVDANPGVDPFIPKPGSIVTIPTAWIPPVPQMRPSIVVNLPEYRLYYFPKEATGSIVTYPLGIGEEGKDTPVGNYRVIQKAVGPSWYVPRSIRAKNRRLPGIVPPGPGNPLGSHALRLSRNSILIHGTNRPWGIGRRSSHGCLRLYPEDIIKLFHLAHRGIQVVIIDQRIKVASRGERVFVEVHRYEGKEPTVGEAMQILADEALLFKTDLSRLVRAVSEKKGVPVEVTLARHLSD